MSETNADIAGEKQALRAKLRFRRRHFSANLDAMARLAAFRVLPEPLSDLLAAHPVVGAYAALDGEPDILPSLTAATAIALPRHAAREPEMHFCLWGMDDSLDKGPWGSLQPGAAAQRAEPGIILCPLLGFDRSGGRIGQGGGHYDRYFAQHPHVLRIGVGWAVQEVDMIPDEPTDIGLDAVLTEQEFFMCGDRL